MGLFRNAAKVWHRTRKRHFGDPPALVPVVRLVGPIGQTGRGGGGITFDALAKPLEKAFAHPGVSAVALAINSPGGTPVQSAMILRHIRDLAEEHEVKVLAFCEDVAASGGYMLALAGDEIIAHQASLVGSIGVVAGGFGFPEAIAKLGIERRVYTAGENKVRLDPFLPEKDSDRAWLGGLQEDIHDLFKTLVRDRRSDKLDQQAGDLFTGDVWTGGRAVDLGLVDTVGAMYPVLKERYGKKVRIRPVRWRKSGLLNMLTADTATHRSERMTAQADAAFAALEARMMWNRWGL